MQGRITLLKIILINLIPVFGYLFFDWTLFEMAVVFFLETCAIYLSHEIYRYFILKTTRLPFVYGLIQLFFTLPVLGGLMFTYGILTYFLTANNSGKAGKPFDNYLDALSEIELLWILLFLLLIEGFSLFQKKRTQTHFKKASSLRVFRRMFYTHFYVIGSLVVLLIIPFGPIAGIIFLIGLKIVMDYFVEDEFAWAKFKKWIKSISPKG